MYSRKDFLTLVLPPLGPEEFYCTVGLKEGSVLQRFVGSIDEISQHADEFVADTYNAFFAMAKYGKDGRRTTKNALALKSFYVDLDCGVGKPFQDISEGLLALREFCKATGLPKPTIIKSGVGAHLYWVCAETLPREKWSLYAERLKELCAEHKFKVDPAVTGEAARILRIPETLHVKDPTNPLPVEVLSVSPEIALADVEILLAPSLGILQAAEGAVKRPIDPTTAALMGNKVAKFKDLLVKSMSGTGCNQIAEAYKNRETLSYDLWWSVLSIANKCIDRDKAIQVMSEGHPDYSWEEADRKANDAGGPHTCARFRAVNPEGCKGCPLKIAGPIALAEYVAEATESDNVVVQVEEKTKEPQQYVIPQYPRPFFRGRNGGIYVRIKNKEGEELEELVYQYDFYLVRRMADANSCETTLMRFHTPNDGVRDFIIDSALLIAKDKLMSELAKRSIVIPSKKQDLVMHYIQRWNDELMQRKADKTRSQYGWTEDNSAFIVGEREITATEVKYSPPSDSTITTSVFFKPKGDFHKWKDIINYYSTPDLAYRAFAFFLGFGTPLMRFTALDGFLLNLMHRNSGTGKSTILHAINSIYGRPKELMMLPKDTINARMNRLGIMQNLPVTMDEVTNMPPENMSQMIYDITSGRGKHRLKQHDNAERFNHTQFQTGIISSSNRAIVDMLLSVKSFPDGELKRVLEIHMPATNTADATWSREHFEPLMTNFGHAGDPYLQAVLGQLGTVEQLLNQTRNKVDAAIRATPNERYWSLIMALSITGGVISRKLGLHDIPIQPVFDYGIKLIEDAREKGKHYMFSTNEFLSTFIGRHYHEILIINGNLDKRTALEHAPIREPRNALSMRYEPDTKILYVSSEAYRRETMRCMLNYEESLAPYIKSKALIVHTGKNGKSYTKSKRMFVGTSASTNAATSCLWFDTTKLDSFNEELIMKPDEDGSDYVIDNDSVA